MEAQLSAIQVTANWEIKLAGAIMVPKIRWKDLPSHKDKPKNMMKDIT